MLLLVVSMGHGGDRNFPGGKKSGPKPKMDEASVVNRMKREASKERTALRKAAAAAAAVDKKQAERRASFEEKRRQQHQEWKEQQHLAMLDWNDWKSMKYQMKLVQKPLQKSLPIVPQLGMK